MNSFDFDYVLESVDSRPVSVLFAWSFSVDVQPVFLEVKPNPFKMWGSTNQNRWSFPTPLLLQPPTGSGRTVFDLSKLKMVKKGETITIHGAQQDTVQVSYLRFGWTTG
jgi:hypothetical protein